MSRVTVRRADAGQAAAFAELGRRHLARWSGSPGGFLTEERLAADFARPGSDPDNDFWCVAVDGRLVAFAELFAGAPYTELEVVLLTDPDLTDGEARAVAEAHLPAAFRAASPYAAQSAPDVEPVLVLHLWPGEPMVEVVREYGFRHARSNFTLVRSLVDPVAVPELPAGVRSRPIDVDRDLEDLTVVLRAFEDHRGDLVFDEDRVRHSLVGPHARPDLGRLAEDELGPCSVVLCDVEPSDTPGSLDGYIEAVATVRRARGRGIAGALLRESFAALHGVGCSGVRLMVDAENTTGALGVYERAGMSREGEQQLWTFPVPRTSGPA